MTDPTDSYLTQLDAAGPQSDQAQYIGALWSGMPAMTQQQYLDTAIAVIRRFHPDAVTFAIGRNEPAEYNLTPGLVTNGYFLCDVHLIDGHVIASDEEIMPVYDATWPLLMSITPPAEHQRFRLNLRRRTTSVIASTSERVVLNMRGETVA
ncbi:hypothetical protein AB0H83_45815 [Dactylosporangium sp. NPDC050688]|uniref:hypothetical protein n=1 Tax=Dactylosporangium sp. NPDC050688 TaxID=3157217 RepID=UPI0034098FD6